MRVLHTISYNFSCSRFFEQQHELGGRENCSCLTPFFCDTCFFASRYWNEPTNRLEFWVAFKDTSGINKKTLSENNIAPENRPSQKESIQGLCLFRECIVLMRNCCLGIRKYRVPICRAHAEPPHFAGQNLQTEQDVLPKGIVITFLEYWDASGCKQLHG